MKAVISVSNCNGGGDPRRPRAGIRRSAMVVAMSVALGLGCLSTSGRESDQESKPLPFWGVAYGPFREGQGPTTRNQPTDANLRADLSRVAQLAVTIRTYSSTGINGRIPELASEVGLDIWCGAWLDPHSAKNDEEVAAALELAKLSGTKAVIVGNECLQHRMTIGDVIPYLRRVRDVLAGKKPVGYADTPSSLIKVAKQLSPEVDVVVVNIHPYWERVNIAKAVQSVETTFATVQAAYPGKEVVIGEVGWPSAGATFGTAQPSLFNEAAFVRAFLLYQQKHPKLKAFFFEAFDEGWKSEGNDGVGTHWGLLNVDGSLKKGLEEVLLVPIERDPTRGSPVDDNLAQSRYRIYDRYLGPKLAMGVNSSTGPTQWVKEDKDNGVLQCNYPPDQTWGALFFTVGPPVDRSKTRPTLDVSRFKFVSFDIRGAKGGESCSVGVKTEADEDDGSEPKHDLVGISKEWKSVRIPLSEFAKNPRDPPGSKPRLSHLYVVFEVVFEPGDPAETILLRNIRFEL